MFVVKVDKNIAKIEEKEEITSGSQNVYVTQFQFSDEWQYLERTARFKAEDKVIDILLDDDNRCMIPWELMTKAKVSIEVGAYGVKDGNVVLPTIWASMPVILQSVLGEDDAAWPSEPTPDVYQQILARLGELEDRIDEGGTGEGGSGQNGKDGKDGKSAYEIAVDNGFEGSEAEWLKSLKGADGSDGAKGDPGDTPYIGENGNWWIGDVDTNVSASGSDGGSVAPSSIDMQTTTLLSTDWDDNNEQTVTVTGISSNELKQLIRPIPASTSMEDYYKHGIVCTNQSANKLIFKALWTPNTDIEVNVFIESLSNNDKKAKVFGVVWDYSKPSTALTRLTKDDDSNRLVTMNVEEEPVAAIGASMGSSPFDNFYPWSEMEEYNIVNGSVSYKSGMDGFSRTEHDTVVYIPEFYYACIDDAENTKRYWYISDSPVNGMEKHPGSGVYVGKYFISEGIETISGVTPKHDISANQATSLVNGKGDGWHACGYAQICAIRLLYLVEFANMNSQDMIGIGTTKGNNGRTDNMLYHTGKSNNAIQYRHIESLYNNYRTWTPGVTFDGSTLKAYICLNPELFSYSITNYVDAEVLLPQTSGYIKALHFCEKFPWAFLPKSIGSNDESYTTDYFYNGGTSGLLAFGSSYDPNSKSDGMFYFDFYRSYTTANSDYSTRAMFIPNT